MLGLIYVIIAQFLWACEFILIRKFFPSQNAIFISALTSIIGSLFYLPFAFIFKQRITGSEWIVLIVLGLSSWFLAQIFFVSGVQKGTSSFALAMATLTLPIATAILGSFFLKEPLTLRMIFGGILMFIGFFILSTH